MVGVTVALVVVRMGVELGEELNTHAAVQQWAATCLY